MTTDYERILLAEGIGYSEILDPKFKTNTLKIFFSQPLSAATAAGSALATSLLTASNQRYPSIAQLRKKLQMLYGAAIFGSVQREGDIQTNHISATVIDDRYALEQEPLFDEVLELLLDCLFRPNAADGAFSQTEFRIRQQNLLDTIKAEIDEKRTYALNQARRTAFDGEPAALSPCGTAEEVAALTPASAYAAYQELLRTAGIEIYFVGPAKKAGLADKLRRAFAAIPDRKPQPLCAIAPSPAKPEPQEVHELLPVAQCKLVLLWKTAYENPWVLAMLSAVFGGTPSSKLFANVREKMSLCYYCAASYSTFKQSLTVDSGIEQQNVEKTRDAILQQLREIQQGNITQEELENAKMSFHDSIYGIGDTPSSYINWYFGQFCKGISLSQDELHEKYQSVTIPQRVEAANTLTLDTIYLMDCKKEAE